MVLGEWNRYATDKQKQRMNKRYEQLAELLDDQQDFAQAADRVRRLMFLEKLLAEIDDGMAALEA